MQKKEQQRWNEMVEGHWWVRGHQDIARTLMSQYLTRGNRQSRNILDIGCSGGGVTVYLQNFGKVYGFDISFDSLQYCRTKNLPVIQSDATKIPFKNSSFNVVSILEVSEHVDDDKELFREINRIGVSGAYVFVMVPAYRFLWGSHDVKYLHKRRYSKRGFLALAASCGFSIERLTFMHPHLLLPLLILRLWDRLFQVNYGSRDDFMSAGWLGDKILSLTMALEKKIIRNFNFSFGICIFCVLRKNTE